MPISTDGFLKPNFLHHRYYGTMTAEDFARGIVTFLDANQQHGPVHMLIDLRDVEAHTLSMVDVYELVKKVSQKHTGSVFVVGNQSRTIQTLTSLIGKVIEYAIPLPYQQVADGEFNFMQYVS